MDRDDCLAALRRIRTDPEELRQLESLLEGLSPNPAGGAVKDRGCVLSIAARSGAFRGFEDTHCSPDDLEPGAFRELAGSRLRRMKDACERLNGELGLEFPARALGGLENWLRAQTRPPWPFFGWKSEGPGRLSLSIYLADARPGPDGTLPPAGLLESVGLRTEAAAEAGLLGRLDCVSVTLGADGGREAKVYVRFPVPEGEPEFSRVLLGHGAQGAAQLHWWRALGRLQAVRFWTQARRLKPSRLRRTAVKTEVHFERPVDPAVLAGASPPDPWLLDSIRTVGRQGGRITCLAAEGGRPFVYYR
jgi:hypothetical protein